MDEVFSAPPVVRHTLIKQGNLNHAVSACPLQAWACTPIHDLCLRRGACMGRGRLGH